MKEKKIENSIWIIFIIVGIILISIGVFFGINRFDYSNKIETIGTIVDISSYKGTDGRREGIVYVSYNVDGMQYESRLNAYSSSFYEGKEIKIYYDKDNPNNIGVKSLDLMILIFPGVGLIFVIIAVIGIAFKMKNKRNEKRLRENGQLIYADYVETVMNTSYTVNGSHPYNIICQWNNPRDNKRYIFKSKNIWVNPHDIITQSNMKKIPVYIDDENKYVVDVDEVTKDIVDLR